MVDGGERAEATRGKRATQKRLLDVEMWQWRHLDVNEHQRVDMKSIADKQKRHFHRGAMIPLLFTIN